jgi:hypothetical protein
MKKILVIAILIIAGCSKEASHPEVEIYGTWGQSFSMSPEDIFLETTGNYLSVNRYIFKNDNSFESFSFVMDEDSFEILGYWSHMDGTFSTQGNRLILNFNRYSIDNAENDFPLLPKEELSLVGEDIEWEFNFSILDNSSILKFDFDPCGPLENCVGSLTLVRVK